MYFFFYEESLALNLTLQVYSKSYYVLFSSVCLAQGPFRALFFCDYILKEEESVPEIPGLARLETMNTHFQLVKDKIDIAFA